jgi:hopanoid biosynthesis associated protein HpnK
MTRSLVVNGDDFGLTTGVNRGILDAHTRGILTSASVFANAQATSDAIALAARAPTLAVGCHLTLVDGVPVLPASELPTLAPTGRFRATWGAFIRDAMTGRIRPLEIEMELAAQIQRLADAGVRLTHLDSHKHVHAYPPVFAIVADLAVRFDIATVRVPCERPVLRVLAGHAGRAGARRQAIENAFLAPWCARDRAILERRGLPAASAFLGRALTGLFTPESLRALIERVPAGRTELMTHPGYVDAALDGVRTRLRRQRAEEVALLSDPSLGSLIHRAGIVLTRPDGDIRFQRCAHG